MRFLIVAMSMLIFLTPSANAEIHLGISIGVNVPVYPTLVPVPGYPVYYDPDLDSNYFFYDGQYWVYDNDNWYSSDWYNGPWQLVEPDYVPLFILRVPVRYYHRPPVYFHGWRADLAPHWGEHWGHGWEAQHHNWNHWNHQAAPRPAPLPIYQRKYSGDRYPHGEEQHAIRDQHYHYKPHAPAVNHAPQHNTPQHNNDRPPIAPPKPIQHQPPRPEPHRPPVPKMNDPAHPQPRSTPAPRPPMPHAPAEQHAPPHPVQPSHPQQHPPMSHEHAQPQPHEKQERSSNKDRDDHQDDHH